MTAPTDNHVKVLFRYDSPVLDEVTVETMWAFKVNEGKGIYRLDNIPFYGPPIAPNDEFYAEFDEDEGRLTYRYITKYSDYSVVLVVIMKDDFDKEMIRDEFKALNCTSEGFGDGYFSMEIPKDVDYSTIKPKLDKHSSGGLLDYSEPVLSEKHRKDLNKLSTTRTKNQADIFGKLKEWFLQ